MMILVCGGAGYIGSHMCKRLARDGHEPIVFDNLSTGHEWAVKWGPLVRADLLDAGAVRNVFRAYPIDAVMHFAAHSSVGESLRDPDSYFRTNVTGTRNLLDAMRESGVTKLVFSSTAAVYGDPLYNPIDEAHACAPISPYGWSKLMAERAIEEYCSAGDMRAVSLRYFNAAGADAEGEIGESHDPETHLIPSLIRAALDPSSGPMQIFGNDYETPDGSCVRDYVHVDDLCNAHLLALEYLAQGSAYRTFNLGSGRGYSVAEVLAACRALCNGQPEAQIVARRPGDPASLVASSAAAASVLGWKPAFALPDCMSTALAWQRKLAAEGG